MRNFEFHSEFLTMKDITSRYNVSRLTIRNWVRKGLFPRGIQVERTHRWSVREIEAWEAAHD